MSGILPKRATGASHGRSVSGEFEAWCGGRFSCVAATPAVGHRFPSLRARQRADITLDTRIASERVRIQLSPERGSGEGRTVRPERLGSRQWRFQMPSGPARARVHMTYPDEGTALALIFLLTG